MVYVGTQKYSRYDKRGYRDYWCSEPEGRQNILSDAEHEADDQVASDYPYAVYRDGQELTRKAEQIFQQWELAVGEPSDMDTGVYPNRNKRNSEAGERKRLYISAFVGAYQKALAKKDEAARPKVQPELQPAATPATPSNVATLQGATLTIKSIDPGDGEMVYTLEINHPGVTNGVEVMQLGHPISTATSTSSYGYAASFSDATTSSSTRLGSSSGVVPLPSETSKQSGFSVKKSGQFYIK